MGFWDNLGNLFDQIGQPRQISGTPNPIRRYLGKGSNRNPFDILTDYTKQQLNPDPTRVYGHFNPTDSNRFHNAQQNLVRTRVNSLLERLNAPPTTADILAQLQQLQDPSRYMTDPGSLEQMARDQAAAQYDPVIAQLESQMGSAQTRAARNKDELGRMYSGLSASLQGDVPGIQQMYSEDKAQSQQMYDQLQQQTQNQYNQSSNEQQQMMDRLNIQAAAPEALAAQQRDKDYFTQLAAQNAATEQTALGKEERGAVNFTNQGSQIARSEGTSKQADLMAQLEDLLGQYSSQIGAQQVAKSNTYQSLLGQLQSDSQQSAVQNAQRDFENYISMIQLGRALDKDKTTGQVGQVKSPADVAGRAMGLGLDQNRAQNVQDVFMTAISSDPQILNGTNVFGQAASKEQMASRIVDAGKKAGLSGADLNVLRTVALEYFGRR